MARMMGALPPSGGLAALVPAAAAAAAPVQALAADNAGSDGADDADTVTAGEDGAATKRKRGRDNQQNSAPPTPSKASNRQHAT